MKDKYENYEYKKILDKISKNPLDEYNQYNKYKKLYPKNPYEYEYWEPKPKKPTDEEVLEKMDIKVIEKFLRKKKLQKLNEKDA